MANVKEYNEYFGFAFYNQNTGKIVDRIAVKDILPEMRNVIKKYTNSSRTYSDNVTLLIFNSLLNKDELCLNLFHIAKNKGLINLLANDLEDIISIKLFYATNKDKTGLSDLKNDMVAYINSSKNHYYEVPIINLDSFVTTDEYKSVIERGNLFNPFIALTKVASKINSSLSSDDEVDDEMIIKYNLFDLVDVKCAFDKSKEFKVWDQYKDAIAIISSYVISNLDKFNDFDIVEFKKKYNCYIDSLKNFTRPITDEQKTNIKSFMAYLNRVFDIKNDIVKSEVNRINNQKFDSLTSKMLSHFELSYAKITQNNDDIDKSLYNRLNKQDRITYLCKKINDIFKKGELYGYFDPESSGNVIKLSCFIDEYNKAVEKENYAEKGHERTR